MRAGTLLSQFLRVFLPTIAPCINRSSQFSKQTKKENNLKLLL